MDWSHADTPRAGDCPIPSIHCRSHVTADTQCRRDDPITRCVSSERIFFAVFEGSNPETFFHDFARGFARDNPSSLRSFRAFESKVMSKRITNEGCYPENWRKIRASSRKLAGIWDPIFAL